MRNVLLAFLGIVMYASTCLGLNVEADSHPRLMFDYNSIEEIRTKISNPNHEYHQIYLASNGDEGVTAGDLDIPMLGLAQGYYAHVALTVDMVNTNSDPADWNSLARVINAAGNTAMIYDEQNVTITKVVPYPTNINVSAENGDIAHHELDGTNYWALYIGDRWTWVEVNTNNFPWQ